MTARISLMAAMVFSQFAVTSGSVLAETAEKNKETVRGLVSILNGKQFDRLDRIVASDFVRHCQATPDLQVRSLDDFKAFLKQDAVSFPDSAVTLHLLVAEGEYVAVFATYKGTQKGQMGPFPATNKQMELDFAGVFRFADGKIAELWLTWDNLAALTQLGLFPPPPAKE